MPVDCGIHGDLRVLFPLLAERCAKQTRPAWAARIKALREKEATLLAEAETGTSFQFLRTGYFCKDPDSTPELPVYNRTVGLRDTFAKQSAGN